MTALGEWLKQLILIVLFAVFAEMLLPTKALERYIRMVLGLALIATMLQPLGILLQKNWASQLAEQAVAEVTRPSAQGNSVGSSGGDLQALQNSLSKDRETEADQLLAARIENGIAEQFNLQPRSVVVSGSASKGNLQVHVTLAQTQMTRASPIAKWVRSELGLSSSRVVVNATGGG